MLLNSSKLPHLRAWDAYCPAASLLFACFLYAASPSHRAGRTFCRMPRHSFSTSWRSLPSTLHSAQWELRHSWIGHLDCFLFVLVAALCAMAAVAIRRAAAKTGNLRMLLASAGPDVKALEPPEFAALAPDCLRAPHFALISQPNLAHYDAGRPCRP